jgi:outer membrane protein assembly factor BamB
MRRILSTAVLSIALLASTHQALAEDWPGWRGPRGDGSSLESSVPTRWSATENIVWKTAIPGLGHSSAIVWGDSVFTTTALPEQADRLLLCFDRKTGKVLWQRTVLTAPLEPKQAENSYASGTPATDGKNVYVAFLDVKEVAVAAYDFAGKQIWLVRPGSLQIDHGFSSSPIVYRDKVLLSVQGKQGNFLVALSQTDGHTIWKTALDNPSNSYGQPLLRTMAGRPQLVLCGDKAVTSFDPESGSRIWYTVCNSSDSVITPVFNEKAGLLLTATSWPTKELEAIKPDGQGNVTKANVAWRNQPGAPYVPSPIAAGDYFFSIADLRSEIYCFNAATGKVLWREPFGHTHASPVLAGGLVYLLNDDGVMNVVRPGDKYELVARNELGEKCYASPAISGGQIFLRSFQSLFCIGR